MLYLFADGSFRTNNKSLFIRLKILKSIAANNYLCSLCSLFELGANGIRYWITHIGISACGKSTFTVRTVCRKVIMQKNREL